MDRLHVFLIDPNQLFREGLKRLLSDGNCIVVGEARSIREVNLALVSDRRIDLVATDFGDDTVAAKATLTAIRARHPGVKIVALADGNNPASLVRAMDWSLDAYLTRHMSADALVRAFALVMAGQQIFPAQVVVTTVSSEAEGALGGSQPGLHYLSPRELEILRCLIDGLSNKAIARRLAISEATVKAHLRTVLRKTRVSNRTQAAVWALDHVQHEQLLAAENG
jgi:two-component system nitrate/nitrite response regulator NarL